jgi:uncharacterized protein
VSAGLVSLQPVGGPPPVASVPPQIHVIPHEPPLALIVRGSHLFAIDPEFAQALARNDLAAEQELLNAAPHAADPPSGAALEAPTALSLNIAQACNLSCTYCYADEGRFHGAAKHMKMPVAAAAIDRLLEGARGRRVTVGFIGGEAFLNRSVLHQAVHYGAARAKDFQTRIGFSVTTNGTLLNAADLDLLRNHDFAVTVSLDGSAEVNDQQRRMHRGSSSFREAVSRVRPLLENQGSARISARATVTREDLRIAEKIEALWAEGFTDIGVSPLRASPNANLAMQEQDWTGLLSEMIRAAEVEWSRVEAGQPIRFANLAIALKQIHRGAARSLPCGSASNYVSVNAEGEYFTCHRTIDDKRFSLGDKQLDDAARARFLAARQVDLQEPCRTCWARYLCGGGCHAEVIQVGRSGCDYIRGWLEHCLRFYYRMLRSHPEFFGQTAHAQAN